MGAENYANVLEILILKYSRGPEKFSGLWETGPASRVRPFTPLLHSPWSQTRIQRETACSLIQNENS